MLTILIVGAFLCLGLAAWAGLFKRFAYWMWTSPINERLAPAWYAKNRDKIEAMRARGRV